MESYINNLNEISSRSVDSGAFDVILSAERRMLIMGNYDDYIQQKICIIDLLFTKKKRFYFKKQVSKRHCEKFSFNLLYPFRNYARFNTDLTEVSLEIIILM